MSARNTLERLVAVIEEAGELAEELLNGQVSWTNLKWYADPIHREFGWVREALDGDEADKELQLGQFEYFMALTYVGETPLLVAKAILKLELSIRESQGEIVSRVEDAELWEVHEQVTRGSERLRAARRKMGKLGSTRRLVKLCWTARSLNRAKKGAAPGSIANHRVIRIPLGFGDLDFMLQVAGAAITQLVYLNTLSTFVFNDTEATADAAIFSDPSTCLKMVRELLLESPIRESSEKASGALVMASGLALMKMESLLARSRLSAEGMLIRSKIYLLRAAAFLGHCWAARRFEKQTGQDTNDEQQRALLFGRRCTEQAGEFATVSRSLTFHDWRWKLMGAQLDVRLPGFDRLASLAYQDVRSLAASLHEQFNQEEARVGPARVVDDHNQATKS